MGYISKISAGGTTATIGGGAFDKCAVYSCYTILNGASAAANKFYTYSLSSYLPSDSSTYDYEVLFEGYGASGSSSGNSIVFRLYSGTVTSADTYSSYLLGCCTARTAKSVCMGGSAWVPIYSNDRNVTFWNSGTASSSLSLKAVCYKKIGNNQ